MLEYNGEFCRDDGGQMFRDFDRVDDFGDASSKFNITTILN